MISRWHSALILPLFCLFLLLPNVSSATTETPAAAEIKVEETAWQDQVKALNQELSEIAALQNQTSGEDKLALQLQMFQKNDQLRTLLASGVKDSNVDRDFLISQIKQQQKFSDQGVKYLTERSSNLSEKLTEAKSEEKFAVLAEYEEARKYLDNLYTDQSQNLAWLKTLGVVSPKTEEAFTKEVNKRIEQVAANVEYLRQQLSADDAQLKVAPEGEKPAIQLRQLITQRRMAITTDSLAVLIEEADKVDIPTADYKRLYFEVTGSVTQDLLSTDVLLSIVKTWSSKFWGWLVENAPQHMFQLLVFLIILLIAHQVAKVTRAVVKRAVGSKNLKFSQLMQDFFISMSGKAIWVVGILIALSQIGLNLTPILTGFGIAGVIVGFALQDTLSNFAAGMMLLIYRPFDVGDFVQAGGVEGKVSHMSLVNTTIKTFDNQIIIVPNSKIWGDVIKNVTHERVRRVDMVFGVSYSDDVEQVEKVLLDIVTSHPSVLRSPEPVIKLHVLNSSSLDFIVRPWVKTDDYWDVYWDVTREVKIRFDKEGISIPFPQQDVHLHMASGQLPPKVE